MTVAALIVGVVQIYESDREHESERGADSRKIGELTGAVQALTATNNTQYDRNQVELRKLQDQLSDIKRDKASEELRRKMAVLQKQLDKSIAPKPKARIEVSFYYPKMKDGEVQKSRYVTADGEIVSFPFFVANTSNTNATGLTLWMRICDDCRYHRDPPGSIKVSGAQDSDRIYQIAELPPGVASNKWDVDIELPRKFTQMNILFKYRCADCELDKGWQTLTADVGRAGVREFYPANTTKSKKPKM